MPNPPILYYSCHNVMYNEAKSNVCVCTNRFPGSSLASPRPLPLNSSTNDIMHMHKQCVTGFSSGRWGRAGGPGDEASSPPASWLYNVGQMERDYVNRKAVEEPAFKR